MQLAGDQWQEFFHSFHRSAFRLETLSAYGVSEEDDEFRRFLSGEKRPASEAEADDYLIRIRDHVARGKSMRRVHTLTSPLSTYLKFEFEWFYPFSVEAGEDIRIIDFAHTPNPGLPQQDFWLFDEQYVVLMYYAPDGTQTGRELLEGVDPAAYIRYRDLALEHSAPFNEYYKV